MFVDAPREATDAAEELPAGVFAVRPDVLAEPRLLFPGEAWIRLRLRFLAEEPAKTFGFFWITRVVRAPSAAIESWMMLATVASTVPSTSLCKTRCYRAARSTGSSTFTYIRVTSFSSSRISSTVGTCPEGKSLAARLRSRGLLGGDG